MNQAGTNLMQVKLKKFSPVRLSLRNNHYIVSKDFLGKYVECLHSFTYLRATIEEKIHFDIEKSFVIHGKLLTISSLSKFTYGPLGDKTSIKVYYDNELISDFIGNISYMGAYTNGNFPNIKTRDWQIVFTITWTPKAEENLWSVDYYENLLSAPRNQPLLMPIKQGSKPCENGLTKEEYTFEEIENFKSVCWTYPIYDDNNQYLGELSFCEYEGFSQCDYWVTGKFDYGEKIPSIPDRIERDDKGLLQTLELKTLNRLEREVVSENISKGMTKEQYYKNKL